MTFLVSAAQAAESISPVAEPGFHFIWAISFGQVITAGIALLGAFAVIVKLKATVEALQKNQADLAERVGKISDDVGRLDNETRQDVRELRQTVNDLNHTLLSLRVIGFEGKPAKAPPRRSRARKPREQENAG